MKRMFLSLSILCFVTSTFVIADTVVPKSDAEVVNMLMTINTEEMNLAKAGMKKAENKKVKQFADEMFKAHTKNNDQAAALRNKNNIKLTETGKSKELKTRVENSVEKIKNLEGKEFDKAFMEAQVVLHQKALHKLETNLLPNAKDSELKDMLQKTKEHVKAHLRDAQEIKSSI